MATRNKKCPVENPFLKIVKSIPPVVAEMTEKKEVASEPGLVAMTPEDERDERRELIVGEAKMAFKEFAQKYLSKKISGWAKGKNVSQGEINQLMVNFLSQGEDMINEVVEAVLIGVAENRVAPDIEAYRDFAHDYFLGKMIEQAEDFWRGKSESKELKESNYSLNSLQDFENFSQKTDLEPKESYEESLERALEALKDTKGIVELKKQDVPTIVISDLHARRDFLANVLSQKDNDGKTVLELLKEGKINVVCLGDGMHSEDGKNWDVFDPNPAKGEGYMELNPKKLEKEMVASLGLMKMVMEMKAAFPDSFHYVRGNHDDIDESLTKFLKHVPEELGGESGIVKWWTENHLGQDFLQKWAKFESRLPLVVKGNGFVASHTVPKDPLTHQQINSRDENAVWQLLWTDNTEFSDQEPGLQQMFQENLKSLGATDSIWIIGHRQVFQRKYRDQFKGQLIQINSDRRQSIAVFNPSKSFNPEKNIFDLKVDKIDGLEIPGTENEEHVGAPEKGYDDLYSREQREWIDGLGEEAQEAYDLVFKGLKDIGELEDTTDEEIISGRIKPYLKKIFRTKIKGNRGFTEKDRDYAVQSAVSKVKFKVRKEL